MSTFNSTNKIKHWVILRAIILSGWLLRITKIVISSFKIRVERLQEVKVKFFFLLGICLLTIQLRAMLRDVQRLEAQ